MKEANPKNFFYNIPRNIIQAFSGRNIFWHLAAIVITLILIISGFDWKYFVYFHATTIREFLFAGVIVGGLVPIFLPLITLVYGVLRKNARALTTAFALGQGAVAGYLVSIFYKAFTGRLHPTFSSPLLSDLSREFRFGFLEGGVFWGWPSSHTTVAFAMAFSLIALYPGNKALRYGAIVYALFIGIGVSMSIHWFSDFAAGALIGTVVGTAVGNSFFSALNPDYSVRIVPL